MKIFRSVKSRPLIIGISVIILVVSLMLIFGEVTYDRTPRAKADLEALAMALRHYHDHHGKWPLPEHGLLSLIQQPTKEFDPGWRPFLGNLPKDPWGNYYMVDYDAYRPVAVWSHGPSPSASDAITHYLEE